MNNALINNPSYDNFKNQKKIKIYQSKNVYNQDFFSKNEFKNYNRLFLRSIKHKKVSELTKYILLDLKHQNYLLNNFKFCQQFIEEERNKLINNKTVNFNNTMILITYWYHEKYIDQIMSQVKYKNTLIFMNELIFYDNNIKNFYIY